MKIVLFSLLLMLTLVGCDKSQEVITTESGIRYSDDKVGTGDEVKEGQLITVHFAGWVVTDSTNLFSDWLIDSTKMMQSIGNSRTNNKPVKFILSPDNFIPGIEDGIKGMKKGGTRTIIIPSELLTAAAPPNPMSTQPDLKVVVELIEYKEVKPVKMWDVDTTNIKTTSSGLKYIMVKEGEGDSAKTGSEVTVHYSGFLENGKRIDSSVEKEEPIVFMLGRNMVMAGWEEGLTLLKKGGKIRLIIPPSLAYGENPRPNVPINSTLIFDVELVDLK